MMKRLGLFFKIFALSVFVFGAITYTSVSLTARKEKPKSFVITYLITRSENGQEPVITGLAVKTVADDGQYKRIIVRRLDNEYNRQVSVRFLDNLASYRLETDRLDYEGAAEQEIERDKTARRADWVTSSPLFVREGQMLGLEVYFTHQPVNDGWVDQAFSVQTRSAPLLLREHLGNVEYVEEAISIEFRNVSPDEIKPPGLPISFEMAKKMEKEMASNPENADTIKRLVERRESVMGKLRTSGRIE